MSQLSDYQKILKGKGADEILRWAAAEFSAGVAFASSLGLEDQVITAYIATGALDIPIFTLDTGRLFPEAYDLIETTENIYNIKIDAYSPDASELEKFTNENGINSFRKSVELRKECCRIRKLGPLGRALSGKKAWVCGLRKAQSTSRSQVEVIEWDEAHKMYKINPLINWTQEQTREYINDNNVPYNKLHDEGFISIGCACCTRAIKEGEDIRAGRWWWESEEHKECGLHRRPSKVKEKS